MPRRIKKNISKEAEKKNKKKLPKKVKLDVRVSKASYSEEFKEEYNEIVTQKDNLFLEKETEEVCEEYSAAEQGGDKFFAGGAPEKSERENIKAKYNKCENNTNREERNREKIEKDKMLILYSGVAFFMILFAVVWAVNFKSIFGANQPNSDSDTQLKEISGKFSDSIKNLKENIAAIKSEISTTTEQTGAAGGDGADKEINNVLPANSDEINQDKIEILKKKLEKID